MRFPGGTDGKEPACQCRRCKKDRFYPWEGKISWRRSTGMATNSNILAWEIPWTEESGGLQSMGSQRVGHDWETNTQRTYVASSYKISKSCGCDVQHGDYSYIICLKMAKKIDLKSSHCKKKSCDCVVMNVNWTYCDDHLDKYQIIILYTWK